LLVCDHLSLQELQRPALSSLRRIRAGEGDEVRFGAVGKLSGLSWSRLLVEGSIQSAFAVLITYSLDGAFADPEYTRDHGFTRAPLTQEKSSRTIDDSTVVLSLPCDTL
jgi:hypothetical protein